MTIRTVFVLPGLHRVRRGAETAFEAVARELARTDGFEVSVIGSGDSRPGEPYRYLRASCVDRRRFERFPRIPPFRGDTVYEEFSFLPALLRRYDPRAYDVTLTCGYPFVNWLLRARSPGGVRPAHVFVTENGDWPCTATDSEYRWFACDGLVCVNPEHFDRCRMRWRSVLVPNGVDPSRFSPGPRDLARFGVPEGGPVLLMVSALIPSKRVVEAVRAVAPIEGLRLVVAGDGPLRDEADRAGAALMPGRFRRVCVPRDEMPVLYRSADAFLHMSTGESSPNAYAEALATGLPVVAHDGPLERWTFEDCALLVDANDLGAVAGAVRRVLGDGAAGRDARMALAARRFAWPVIAAQYAEFLRDVVGARARSPAPARAAPAECSAS